MNTTLEPIQPNPPHYRPWPCPLYAITRGVCAGLPVAQDARRTMLGYAKREVRDELRDRWDHERWPLFRRNYADAVARWQDG